MVLIAEFYCSFKSTKYRSSFHFYTRQFVFLFLYEHLSRRQIYGGNGSPYISNCLIWVNCVLKVWPVICLTQIT